MTDDELLERYRVVGEFLSLCFSDKIEVVIHDVRGDLQHSAVAIFNNHISGRQPGAPMTKLGTQFIREEVYKKKDFICNYEGVTINGVSVRASTLFIKNKKGKIIGFLCVNVDVSDYALAAKVLNDFVRFGLEQNNLPAETQRYMEDFPHKVSDIAGQIITEYCLQNHKRNDGLNSDDKYEIINRLEQAGLFSIKGSIGDVAVSLKLSEPTIYRYLKKIRKEQ